MTGKKPLKPSAAGWTLSLLSRVLRAEIRDDRSISGICTDSRRAVEGELFFAIQGEKFDGHAFVDSALEAGAVAAVVSRTRVAPTDPRPLIRVEDPLRALGALAAWHRSRMAARVVGVTGSTGKTTTKDFLTALLSSRFRLLSSRASYNNEIGLPLTLLELRPEHEIAVLEMAMRGAGQIRDLAEISRPNAGLITNIGFSHMELLGSQQAIARAKAELLDYLPHSGAAVLPMGDPFFELLRASVPPGVEVITAGLDVPEASLCGRYLGPEWPEDGSMPGGRLQVRENGREYELRVPVPGAHNAQNALMAAAAGRYFGLDWSEIRAGLEGASISAMRMAVHRIGRAILLDDAYNASTPEAMEAALAVLEGAPRGRKLAIIGDMLELGDASAEAHARVGRRVAQLDQAFLITVGERARGVADAAMESGLPAGRVRSAGSIPEAAESARSWIDPDTAVLVKASRGMALEALVSELLEGSKS